MALQKVTNCSPLNPFVVCNDSYDTLSERPTFNTGRSRDTQQLLTSICPLANIPSAQSPNMLATTRTHVSYTP